MAFHTNLAQTSVPFIIASVFVYIVHSQASALLDKSDTDTFACPRGWIHYHRFCVTRGVGTSDRAVAVYCDGFGGIGIKGLCIIRAHENKPLSSVLEEDSSASLSSRASSQGDNALQSSQDTESSLSGPLDDPTEDSDLVHFRGHPDTYASRLFQTDAQSEDVSEEACPSGWSLHRSLCVYKPWSVKERCHLMNAVEFHGLCLKHANTRARQNESDDDVYREDKRICCCAHMGSRGNRYGC